MLCGETHNPACLLLGAEEAQITVSGEACGAQAGLGHGSCARYASGGHRPGSQAWMSCGPTLSSLTMGLERPRRQAAGVAPVMDGHPFSSPALIAQASFESTVSEQTRQNSLGVSRLTSFLRLAPASMGKETQQVSSARRALLCIDVAAPQVLLSVLFSLSLARLDASPFFL